LWEELKKNPQTIQSVWISVITFAGVPEQICPLTEIPDFNPPTLGVGPATNLGAALDLLGKCIAREVHFSTSTQKGDKPPIVFLATDGSPTDNWRGALARFVRPQHRDHLPQFVVLGCGEDLGGGFLDQVTPADVFRRDAFPETWKRIFRWVLRFVSAKAGGKNPPSLRAAGVEKAVVRQPERGGKPATPCTQYAQVMIVLDRTGNTAPLINGVKDGILGFVAALSRERFEAEVGLTTFQDLHVPPERGGPQRSVVHKFSGLHFTSDVEEVRAKLNGLQARGGGGDRWESSFETMYKACREPSFRRDAKKFLCVITNAPPHSPYSPGSCWPDGDLKDMDDLRLALQRPPINHVYFIVLPKYRHEFEHVKPYVATEFFDLPKRGDTQDAFNQILDKIAQDIAGRGKKLSPTP
jgi:uncharacterized protein YegL